MHSLPVHQTEARPPLSLSGPKSPINPYWFSSELHDSDFDLYHYPRRVYIPALQRWLNQDPIGLRGGINLFAYVGNDSVNWIDPLGLCGCADLRSRLAYAESVLAKNEAYFSPGGQYASLPGIISANDAFSEGTGIAGLGAAGRAAYLGSRMNVGSSLPYGMTGYTTPVMAGRVGLALGVVGTANDARILLFDSHDASDVIANSANLALDGIGFIPGVGLVASTGQLLVGTALTAYTAELNSENRANTIQSANVSQATILAAQNAIARLSAEMANSGYK